MGLSSFIKTIHEQQDFVVSSVPAFYTAIQHTIFTITGGPVWIKAIVEYLDTAMTNATTTTIVVCGVGMDAGPVAIGPTTAGRLVVSPLQGIPKLAHNAAMPMPTTASVIGNGGWGTVAGVGNGGLIQCTFATVMAAADRWSLHIVYQKLSSDSLIS